MLNIYFLLKIVWYFCCVYELIEFIKNVMHICSINIEHTYIYIQYVRIKNFPILIKQCLSLSTASPDFLFIYIIKNYLFNSFYFWKILAFFSFFSDFIIWSWGKESCNLIYFIKTCQQLFFFFMLQIPPDIQQLKIY